MLRRAPPGPLAASDSPRTPRAADGALPALTAYQLLSETPAELVATVGDCLLVMLRQTLSIVGVSAIQRGFEQLETDYESVGYFSYIDGDRCTWMAPSARGLMTQVVRRHSRRIGAAAIVVGGDGFRATVVRGILRGIH